MTPENIAKAFSGDVFQDMRFTSLVKGEGDVTFRVICLSRSSDVWVCKDELSDRWTLWWAGCIKNALAGKYPGGGWIVNWRTRPFEFS